MRLKYKRLIESQGLNPDRYKVIANLDYALILKDRLTGTTKEIRKEENHENHNSNISQRS